MSMNFNDAQQLDMVTSDLVMADWPRGKNRAQIASLADGNPPLTPEEALSAKVKTNVNDLKHTATLHDARAQYANGFLQQGQYMTCKTDRGAKHKRELWSVIVEKEANRPLLESIEYFEVKRSEFALLVLHGIAPVIWKDEYCVIPESVSVADALIPSNTKIGFTNLPLITLRRSLTGMELAELTQNSKRSPGWNMPYVEKLIKWVDKQMLTGLAGEYNAFYRPEQWEQDVKQRSGWYMPDRVPTIDVFDIYGHVEATDKQPEGWVRRMMLDTWGSPSAGAPKPSRRSDMGGMDKFGKDDFIFSSNSRPVASSWENIAAFQYADLTAVAPFYHNAVKSLGWMIYAPCHLQNRMKCRIYDSCFEQLLQYFHVSDQDDVQNAMKVELANMGFLDDSIKMVKAAERWQPNANFFEMGLGILGGDIANNSKGWTQDLGQGGANTEKTKFQYMAELQKMTALVGSGLNQAHRYAKFQYREIFRRLLVPNSKDPVARTFRLNCLLQGVPEELLVPEAWIIDSEKMMGQGNQTLELMVAQELLQLAPGLDPEPQRIAKRNFIMALTHNPTMALELMPEKPSTGSQAQGESARVCSALLQGIPADMEAGTNPIEYIGHMLKILKLKVDMANKTPQKMVAPDKLQGLQSIAQNIAAHIKQLEQDKTQAQFVKQAGDILGKLVNELKAFGQRLQAAAKKQAQAAQQGNGNGGGETAAKILPAMIIAKSKAKIAESAAAQKKQHKDIAFMQELKHKKLRTQADVAALDVRTAADINRGGMKSFGEGEE